MGQDSGSEKANSYTKRQATVHNDSDLESQIGSDNMSMRSVARPVTPPMRTPNDSMVAIDNKSNLSGGSNITPPSYLELLQDFASSNARDELEIPIALSERLAHLNITYLFNELIKIKRDVTQSPIKDENQMERLGDLLHRYTQAIRDYEYMKQLHTKPRPQASELKSQFEAKFPDIGQTVQVHGSRHGDNVQFHSPYRINFLTLEKFATQGKDSIREFVSRWLPTSFTWTKRDQKDHALEFSENAQPQRYSEQFEMLARFIVALIGALWLLVPFLIMVFDPSRNKTVITVCVATVLFAIDASIILRLSNQETVVSTATYVAVLVVFVGGT